MDIVELQKATKLDSFLVNVGTLFPDVYAAVWGTEPNQTARGADCQIRFRSDWQDKEYSSGCNPEHRLANDISAQLERLTSIGSADDIVKFYEDTVASGWTGFFGTLYYSVSLAITGHADRALDVLPRIDSLRSDEAQTS